MEDGKIIKVLIKFEKHQFAINLPSHTRLKQLKFICYQKFRKVHPSLVLSKCELIDPRSSYAYSELESTLSFLSDGELNLTLNFSRGPGLIMSSIYSTGRWFLRRFDDISPYLESYSNTVNTLGINSPMVMTTLPDYGLNNYDKNY